MKKIAILCATLIFMTHITVLAEDILKTIPEFKDFNLHSEVMFGDSISEVENKEKNKSFDPEYDEFMGMKRIFVRGTFADIPDSQLRYQFVEPEGLYCSCYLFNTDSDRKYSLKEQSSDFDVITDALTNKYGSPIYSGDEDIPFLLIENYREDMTVSGFQQYFENEDEQLFDYKIYGYNQWIIKTSDYYVLIDHNLFEVDGSYYDHKLYYVCLDEDTVLDTFNLSLKATSIPSNDDL